MIGETGAEVRVPDEMSDGMPDGMSDRAASDGGFDIEEELKKLPGSPGVYLMHDERDVIIYVGKAVSLKNRVRQYFQSSRNKGPKIEQMVTHIRRFEYIVTDSELEALVLECNLIKEHRPKYNTMLMDDKAYPYIKVTVKEAFPRVMLARRVVKDKARYFGPYTSAQAVKDTIELLRKLYKVRTCSRVLPRDTGKERPCLYHHIGQCDAPCNALISPDAYRDSVDCVIRFLNGNYEEVSEQLRIRMEEASEALDFERAITYRELLTSVRKISEKQKMEDGSGADRDIVAMASDGQDAVVQVFFIRGGRLLGREHFYVRISYGERQASVLESFLKQYYGATPFVPPAIMLPVTVEDHELIAQWLTNRRGAKVELLVPKKGQKEKLVELAANNARLVLEKDRERLRREEGRTIGAVKELAAFLGIQVPVRMEAFDISNTSGFESVGSMIVYERGKPRRNAYRKFKIRTVQGPDDYASMREVLSRRFAHGMREGKLASGFEQLPDLILMDGGKGQVHICESVLEQFGLSIPVCGMVKDDAHRTRGLYYRDKELAIDRRTECFKLITRVQDEAHRFAIEYHRQLRGKAQVRSILDDIPDVGAARRKALLRHFQNIESIRDASVDELKNVPTMNEKAARSVYHFFHSGGSDAQSDPK